MVILESCHSLCICQDAFIIQLEESCMGKIFLKVIWAGLWIDCKCIPCTHKAEGSSCPKVAKSILSCTAFDTLPSHTAITVTTSTITATASIIIVTTIITTTVMI